MRSDSQDNGISEESQGYSSYYNYSRHDFIVLEFDTDYQGNALLLVFALITLAIFVTVAGPLLLYAHYNTLHSLAKEEDSGYVYIIWGTAIVCFFTVIAVLTVDTLFLVKELGDDPPSLWQYIVGLSCFVILVTLDLALAILLPKRKDFPLPTLLKMICCQEYGFCSGTTLVVQIGAILFTIMAVQLVTFHASFIFLAFIASPVEAASTTLLYVAAIFCAVSLASLFFSVFQKGRRANQNKRQFIFQRVIYLVLFFCVLAFVILYSACFLRVTIYAGDFESGGLPALFASLAPSILLGALGFIAKKVMEKYSLKKQSDELETHNAHNVENGNSRNVSSQQASTALSTRKSYPKGFTQMSTQMAATATL